MIPEVRFRREVHGLSATAAITGAAPQVVNGNTVELSQVEPGTLSANVTALADTDTITLTGSWQVQLKDGTTWVDLAHSSQNPAGVAFATGTAGADTAVSLVFPFPAEGHGYRRARFIVTSGTGVGGGAGVDEVSVLNYSYVTPGF